MAARRAGTGEFQYQVTEDFDGLTMQQYLDRMVDKLHRAALRNATKKAGAMLAAEIRRQIKTRDMPYSRARNAQERRKARKGGQVPLARTIQSRAWTVPRRGIIGVVVGPKWPEGAHGHLVEFGHRIAGHAWGGGKKGRRLMHRRISRQGERTIAHGFQAAAADRVQADVGATMAAALRDFVARQERKGTRIWRS